MIVPHPANVKMAWQYYFRMVQPYLLKRRSVL